MAVVNPATLQYQLDIRAISQQELAQRTGIQESSLSAWKQGRRSLNAVSLRRIDAVLTESPVRPNLKAILEEPQPENKNSRPARPRAAVEEARNAGPRTPQAA